MKDYENIKIYGWMFNRLNLTASQAMTYAKLYKATGFATKTLHIDNPNLASMLDLNPGQTVGMLKILADKKLIRVVRSGKGFAKGTCTIMLNNTDYG